MFSIENLFMELSIAMAEKSVNDGLKVGAVLVSADKKTVLGTWNNDLTQGSWSDSLIIRAAKWKIKNATALYLTINTYDKVNGTFHLKDILKDISVDDIYIGLPDPNICNYLDNDPVLWADNIKRYPDKYQREILVQNSEAYKNSNQSIDNSPYFHDVRISNLIIESLKGQGIFITKDQLNEHKSKDSLKTYLVEHFEIELPKADYLVSEAISYAFNQKYGTYEYVNDTRSLDAEWKQNFSLVLSQTHTTDIDNSAVIDVGVGGGQEATTIFANCTNITFVDVAYDGLKKVQKSIPAAHTVHASADDMHVLRDKFFDVYISLRTYNSSFFDIEKAIEEAKRVLKENAVIIVSVANGFLCPQKKSIIPGLLLPGTDYVDLYRGLETTNFIRRLYVNVGFKEIQLYPTPTEIYLTAKVA